MHRAWKLWACLGVPAVLLLWGVSAHAEHPANGWIVWASDRQDARHEIYLMQADGTGVTRLTHSGARMPMWSPDSRWIAYETVPQERTRIMRWDGSEDHEVFAGVPKFWLWDGSRLVCMDPSDDLYRVDPETGQADFWLHKSDFAHLADKSWSPSGLTADGRWLVTWTDRYRNGYTGTNGQFNAYHAAVILDLDNRGDIWFFGHGCEPTTPPTGPYVYHVCGGTFCSWPPDVYRMEVADRQDRSSYEAEMAHEDADWGHEYFPRISTDNNWLTYGASTGCHDHDTCDYEIYIHRLGAGSSNRERLTSHAGNDQWPHLYVGELWGGAEPSLVLSPAGLSFSAIVGGADPPDQTVSVTNGGGDTLDPVGVSDDAGWLDVSAAGSGNQQMIEHAVSISGLSTGTHQATVTVSCANADNSPQQYAVTIELSEQPELATIEVTASSDSILPGDSVDLFATLHDQNGAPFAAQLAWTVSGGGSMDPVSSPGPITEHTSTFSSDGTTGTWTVTASSDAVEGSAPVTVAEVALPLRINCGSNDHDVDGWDRDDLFVSGGSDWVNPDEVDTSGVANAAPAEVYKSVRHTSPHAYELPLPNGDYLLRLHFADAYEDRSMDYYVEGIQILDDFDIASEAGGINRALVRDFDVTVSDGNGMRIEALSEGDVFEAGIEVYAAVVEPEIDLLVPDGGEIWYAGDTQHIQWAASGVEAVVVRYTTDDGGSWQEVAARVERGAAGWGNLSWAVPATPSTACRVRVMDYDGGVTAESAGLFTIAVREGGPEPDATADGGPQPDGGGPAADEEIVIEGGCNGCAGTASRGGSFWLMPWMLILLIVRRRLEAPARRCPK